MGSRGGREAQQVRVGGTLGACGQEEAPEREAGERTEPATKAPSISPASGHGDLIAATEPPSIYLLGHYKIPSIIKNKMQLSKWANKVHLVMNYPGYAKRCLLPRLLSHGSH